MRRSSILASHLGLWVHELGHLEGLVHANAMACDASGNHVMYAPSAYCDRRGMRSACDAPLEALEGVRAGGG